MHHPRFARWVFAAGVAILVSGVPAGALAATSQPGSPGTSAPAAVHSCAGSQLAVLTTKPEAGLQAVEWAIRFTNTSMVACTIRGYPAVTALNRSGHSIRAAYRQEGLRVRTITLAPSATAHAWVNLFDPFNRPDSSACHPVNAQYLAVTVPNTHKVDRPRLNTSQGLLEVCSGGYNNLSVQPVAAGTAGLLH
jgi:hypothetical protein